MRSPPSGSAFVVAAGIFSAATIDPIVEALSNAGLFGTGSFTDHSNADVIPALFLAVGMLVLVAALRLRRLAGRPSPAWLRFCNSSLERISAHQLIPFVFAMQLVTLFSMETLEQTFVTHHYLGGFVWLGAPPTIALLLHFFGGVVAALLLAHLVRSASAAIVAAISILLNIIGHYRAPLLPRAGSPTAARAISQPLLRLVLGRAPPSLYV